MKVYDPFSTLNGLTEMINQANQIRDLMYGNSAFNTILEQQRITSSISDMIWRHQNSWSANPALRNMLELSQYTSSANPLQNYWRLTEIQSLPIKQAITQLNAISEIQDSFYRISNITALEVFNDLGVLRGMLPPHYHEEFDEYLGDIEPDKISTAADQVDEWLSSVFSKLSLVIKSTKSVLQKREARAEIIALVGIVLTALSPDLEEIDALVEKRIEQFAEVQSQLEKESRAVEIYTVQRPVPLNEEQKYHGTLVLMLTEGVEVEVVSRDKKWVKVRAYDPFAQDVVEGWVKKKYLKKIPV